MFSLNTHICICVGNVCRLWLLFVFHWTLGPCKDKSHNIEFQITLDKNTSENSYKCLYQLWVAKQYRLLDTDAQENPKLSIKQARWTDYDAQAFQMTQQYSSRPEKVNAEHIIRFHTKTEVWHVWFEVSQIFTKVYNTLTIRFVISVAINHSICIYSSVCLSDYLNCLCTV